MNCCEKKNKNESKENTKKEDQEKKFKGGKGMETKNMMLWAVIGLLLVGAIFMTVKASSLSGSASGSLDTTGWTANEIMNYEMHGTVPARLAGGSSAPASSGMVGGC